MSGAFAILERFDENANSAREQQTRAADYGEGYAAGEAAARARAGEQNQQLQQAATELQHKLESFDADAARILCEALASAAVKIFPALAKRGFADEAAAAMQDVVNKTGKAEMAIKTAPGEDETLRTAIDALPIGQSASVTEDAGLSPREISAQWDGGGIHFDTEKAIAIFVASLEKAVQELRGQSGQ